MKNIKFIGVTTGLAVILIAAMWYIFTDPPKNTADITKPDEVKDAPSQGPKKRAELRKSPRVLQPIPYNRHKEGKDDKPTFDIDDDEEAKLTNEQRELLAQIRQALEDEKADYLVRLVRKLQASNEWPDGVPLAIRQAAIDALGWFGGPCLAEIAGFLIDPDEDVLESAVDAYESALIEADGDRELSLIVMAASKVLNDFDSMDSILMSLNDMRPSCQWETIQEIWNTGTPNAKKAVQEMISFITDDENAKTLEDLQAYYNDPSGKNWDAADAEDVYGPQGE